MDVFRDCHDFFIRKYLGDRRSPLTDIEVIEVYFSIENGKSCDKREIWKM